VGANTSAAQDLLLEPPSLRLPFFQPAANKAWGGIMTDPPDLGKGHYNAYSIEHNPNSYGSCGGGGSAPDDVHRLRIARTDAHGR